MINNITVRMQATSLTEGGITVTREDVKSFIVSCMVKVNTSTRHAEALANTLVAADYRGHYSHGINRLEMYVHDIKTGITVSDTEPEVLKETAATGYVDGKNTLGPVVGNLCMQLAIKKAREAGVGWVVAKGSNHYGIAGWYSMQASEEGLLGMSFTNTSPLMVPTRATASVLGTNPLTLAAPAKDGDSFVLDMATTAVALGKIEICDVKNTSMPSGWGANAVGKETADPKDVTERGGGLLPLGGTEISSGYKGYGLAMLVEIFCGILSGAHYGPNVRKWKSTDRVADLGQCFIAVDPNAFAPGFEGRMQDLMDICRSSEPAEGEEEVLVAGDPERKHMAHCDQQGGIDYHPNVVSNLDKLAQELGVPQMKRLK